MLGSLFIVAAPSGAGKTSLVNALVSQQENIALSVSHTTRPSRDGEEDGKDYFFVSDETFAEMVAQNAFLEHATVFSPVRIFLPSPQPHHASAWASSQRAPAHRLTPGDR